MLTLHLHVAEDKTCVLTTCVLVYLSKWNWPSLIRSINGEFIFGDFVQLTVFLSLRVLQALQRQFNMDFMIILCDQWQRNFSQILIKIFRIQITLCRISKRAAAQEIVEISYTGILISQSSHTNIHYTHGRFSPCGMLNETAKVYR